MPREDKEKTPEELFQDAWVEMHQKEWLFPQNFNLKSDNGQDVAGPISSQEYLTAFARKNHLFLLRCPGVYNFNIIEANKDKVAFSAHSIQEHGVTPYTVLQLRAPDVHAVADWIWMPDDKRFVFPITMFVGNQLDYCRFLAENRANEDKYFVKKTHVGF